MRSAAVVVAALAAGASAWSNDTVVYTTEIVTAYTTYCPAATMITHGSIIYTVTEATTLTITNCPCTVTKPVISATVTYCSTCPSSSAAAAPVSTSAAAAAPVSSSAAAAAAPAVSSSAAAPAAPPKTGASAAVPVYQNSTAAAATGAPATTVAGAAGSTATSSKPAGPTFTGAANKAFAASGAGLAGLLGLAAYLL